MHITVQIKNVYGADLIYPVDQTALLFTQLTGRKTLTRADIARIKALGYEVRVRQEDITL